MKHLGWLAVATVNQTLPKRVNHLRLNQLLHGLCSTATNRLASIEATELMKKKWLNQRILITLFQPEQPIACCPDQKQPITFSPTEATDPLAYTESTNHLASIEATNKNLCLDQSSNLSPCPHQSKRLHCPNQSSQSHCRPNQKQPITFPQPKEPIPFPGPKQPITLPQSKQPITVFASNQSNPSRWSQKSNQSHWPNQSNQSPSASIKAIHRKSNQSHCSNQSNQSPCLNHKVTNQSRPDQNQPITLPYNHCARPSPRTDGPKTDRSKKSTWYLVRRYRHLP